MTDVSSRIAALHARMRLPVISAPMFLVSTPEMVVNACRAGVMGSFPAPNARTIADLRDWLETISGAVRDTDAPWAFNMITHSSYGRFDEEIALVEEFRPQLVITALGGPHRVTPAVHGYGGLVFADVNSPTYAKKAIDKGADGLVLVCAGAGGHTGTYAMLPFIEEVRGFFDGPLIVGGGIGTGAQIRAVENLSVDFAYVGTKLLASPETMISDAYRDMVVQARMEDLVASKAITGALGNWMRPSLEAAGITAADLESEAKIDFSGDMHAGSKAWKNVWSAGQGVGSVTDIAPIARIVDRMADDYLAAVEAEAARHGFADRLTRRRAA